MTEPLMEELIKDSERLDWLLKQGIAWRGCYEGDWKEGEWLYEVQDARAQIDEAMENNKKYYVIIQLFEKYSFPYRTLSKTERVSAKSELDCANKAIRKYKDIDVDCIFSRTEENGVKVYRVPNYPEYVIMVREV
jgi:hypothetical protein